MPHLDVTVNNRTYSIACADGEEDHLRQLGRIVDGKVRELLSSVGQLGDTRLLLMASIMLADEQMELAGKLAEKTRELARVSEIKETAAGQHGKAEGRAADRLEAAAHRLEELAATLAHA
jgi:cell division protein ZapA